MPRDEVFAIDKDFHLAQQVLAPWIESHDGKLEVSSVKYEAFRYTDAGVTLIFYIHTTSSTGNQHIRVRSQNSKDKRRAALMLDALAESCVSVTFSHKHVSRCWPRATRLKELARRA